MNCTHIFNGKLCGGTVDRILNACLQCGGKACPNCSGSIVEELIWCLHCGYKLKPAISSRSNNRPLEADRHSRERTNQNVTALYTDRHWGSSVDPGELSYYIDALTQIYCHGPGISSVDSYSHSRQLRNTSYSSILSNGRFNMSQRSPQSAEPSGYRSRSPSLANKKTLDFSNIPITQSSHVDCLSFLKAEATGERNEDNNSSTGIDSSSSSEDEVDNRTNDNAANNTNNNVNPSDASQETNPNQSHDPITGRKKRKRKKKKNDGQKNQSSTSIQTEKNTAVKNRPGKENQKTTGQLKAESKIKDKDKIQVHKEYCFHVIMAPTILADHKEDTVIIRVEGISQNKAQQKLSFQRALDDGYAEYKGTVSIPVRTYGLANLCYNYSVLVNGKEEIKEYVFNQGHKKMNNRRLSYKMLEKKETFHIFDSIVRGPMEKDKSIFPEFILKKIQNWLGTSDYQIMLRAEVELVMKTYLPDLQKECTSDVHGEEIISQVGNIYDGLREYYVNLEQLWGSVDDFEKLISQKVFKEKITIYVYN
ncbi:unnamed protein product [Mytilus coruscus]|uniref:Uncharacterized protein n=1 Tax=Mytilus coruscus TaxID=42192 RepID=A0A6J8C7U1_MYTCO|nr:unnamed protein product [Mytilus coruscus]